MNPKLEAIAQCAAADLLKYFTEGEQEILDAWNAVESESQVQETKPVFKLGFAITLDIEGYTMQTALAWSVKHKLDGSRTMPDPDQPQLPMGEDTVTIKTEGVEPVTLTKKHLKKL